MIHSFMWYMHSSRDAVSQVVCCALQTKKKNEFDPETIPWVKWGVNESWSYSLDSIQFADPSIVISQKRKNIFHWNMPSTLSFRLGQFQCSQKPTTRATDRRQSATMIRFSDANCRGWILNHREKRLCTVYRIPNYTQNKPRVVSQTSYKS